MMKWELFVYLFLIGYCVLEYEQRIEKCRAPVSRSVRTKISRGSIDPTNNRFGGGKDVGPLDDEE